MPVTPPLDSIPQLPSKAVSILSKQSNNLIKKISKKIGETLQDTIQLPDDCGCDDPRIQDIKDNIDDAKKLILKLQEIIGIIQKVYAGLQTAMNIATAIKAATFAVPVTGQAALAAELVIVQNMLIANGIQAIKQMDIIPVTLESGMSLINNQLANIVGKLGGICNNETFDVSDRVQKQLDKQFKDGGKSSRVGSGYYNPDGIGWGTHQSRVDDATLGTEVYSTINVSDDDLLEYSNMIDKLVDQQADLLTSVQEAPAQSYTGNVPPKTGLGKSGDYYIDTAAKMMYGPKTNAGWPEPVNY